MVKVEIIKMVVIRQIEVAEWNYLIGPFSVISEISTKIIIRFFDRILRHNFWITNLLHKISDDNDI